MCINFTTLNTNYLTVKNLKFGELLMKAMNLLLSCTLIVKRKSQLIHLL